MLDHIDKNKLNCCKSNLRGCNHVINSINRIKRQNLTSKYRGVCWDATRNKWTAYINWAGRRKYLGRFSSEEQAAKAYDARAKTLHGEYAQLNFTSV